MKKRFLKGLASLTLVIMTSTISFAAPIMIDFTGTITNRSEDSPGTFTDLVPLFEPSEALSGSMSVDFEIPDNEPDPTLGMYLGNFNVSYQFGGFQGTGTGGTTKVEWDSEDPQKSVVTFSVMTDTPGTPFLHYLLVITLLDPLINPPIDDGLPDVTSLNSYQTRSTQLTFVALNGEKFLVGGTADFPVPEPSTMLLLGSGLFCLGAFRKKFNK